jgi:hypothetical protein
MAATMILLSRVFRSGSTNSIGDTRLTAIGGSDNHDPTLPPDALNAIGHPTTVVYAVELSAPGILAGIRSGRVFVDVTGSRGRLLDISAQTQTSSAVMGGVLMVRAGEEIDVEAQVHGCGGCTADLIEQGQDSGRREQVVHGNRASLHWTLDKGPTHRWFFVEVRDSSAQILLLGNPIYVNWSPPQG